MNEQYVEAGPERLASVLIGKGALTDDWLSAYQKVPRHLFVPDTIWPGRGGMNRQSDRVPRAEEPEVWWQAVYSDAPITTQWDDGSYTGPGRGRAPSSSNSMRLGSTRWRWSATGRRATRSAHRTTA